MGVFLHNWDRLVKHGPPKSQTLRGARPNSAKLVQFGSICAEQYSDALVVLSAEHRKASANREWVKTSTEAVGGSHWVGYTTRYRVT